MLLFFVFLLSKKTNEWINKNVLESLGVVWHQFRWFQLNYPKMFSCWLKFASDWCFKDSWPFSNVCWDYQISLRILRDFFTFLDSLRRLDIFFGFLQSHFESFGIYWDCRALFRVLWDFFWTLSWSYWTLFGNRVRDSSKRATSATFKFENGKKSSRVIADTGNRRFNAFK